MTQAVAEERVEAVIISGPRKGEFISVVNGEVEPQLTPAEEAMLDFVVEQAQRVAAKMEATTAAMDSLLQTMRKAGGETNEFSGSLGRDGEITGDNGFAAHTPAREVGPVRAGSLSF